MGVINGDVIKFEYILYDEDGTIVDSSDISNGEPIKIQIGSGQVIRGLENALIGMDIGEEKEFTLDPLEAFGEFEPLLVEKIPKTQFPKDQVIELGKLIEVVGANGMTSPGWIRLIEDDYVIVDMNPPLAGKRIKFEVKLIETGLEPDPIPNPFQMGMSCDGACDHDHSVN
jgi:peptidylprolyl isomerase